MLHPQSELAIELPNPLGLCDASSCLVAIERVETDYARFNRVDCGARRTVQCKLETILWRSGVLSRLLRGPKPASPGGRAQLLGALEALNVRLGETQLRRARDMLDPGQYAQLQAAMGTTPANFPALAERSGPGIDLDIVANRRSRWPFEKWRRQLRFSRYEAAGEGVRYRGVEFLPGDVLLANVNLDGNGVYTSLSDPKSFSSHSAFFAVLSHDGRRFPVVVETFEKGVRPVPLNVFLGPRFCAYVEVYRHAEYSDGFAAEFNAAAARCIDRVRGYNFDPEDPDPDYLSCTSLGRFLHAEAGLTPVPTVSRFEHPNIRANLLRLGYSCLDFFAPVDFLLSEHLRYAGRVDNNQLERLVARELVDREFRRQFEERELDARRFPAIGRLNRWGIGQIRRGTLAGKLIGTMEGFDRHSLPKGPDELMAVIKLAEKQLGAVIRTATAAVAQEIRRSDGLELADLMNHPGINDTIVRALALPWLPPTGQRAQS